MKLLEVAYWPQVLKEVWECTENSLTCQQYKPDCKKPAGLLQSTALTEPGEMWGVDLMGPLPRSKKCHQSLLVVVDYFTKWMELFPLRDAKTIKMLLNRLLVSGG